jgi:acetyl esterase
MNENPSSPFTSAVQALMDNVKRAGFPPIHTQPIEQARQSYKIGVGATTAPPLPMARTEDFTIPGPAGEMRARLWAASTDPSLPALLYLHGGGFVIGGIETCESMCTVLAQHSGGAVVAVDYRLAPENKFPAGLDDSFAALKWLAEHGHTKGLDRQRIAVGGDSAGGTLAASTALLARDAGIPLVLQALFYPSVQLGMRTNSLLTYSANTLLSWELMHWFELNARGGELRERWHREPLHAPEHGGVAQAWIGLAECDPLTDEGQLYAQKLKDAGVPVDLKVWPGVIHDFINLGRFIPEAADAHLQLAAALRRAYQG